MVGRPFCLIAAAIIASFGVVQVSGVRATRRTRALVADRETIGDLSELLSAAKDAEAGQRGYILTGDSRYLEPYRTALAAIRARRAQLASAARTERLPAEAVALLDTLVERRIAELDRTLRLMRAEGAAAAVREVKAGDGRRTMEELRAATDTLLSIEEQRASQDIAGARREITIRSFVFVVVGLLNVLLLYWFYCRVRDEIAARQAAVEDSRRESQSLRTTLASIGDGVIITDKEGKVRFLNPEAQRITGWLPAEANDRPVGDVFQVLDEETRTPAADPVGRALREGRAVRLAGRAVLVTKAGAEIPVEDSAAPILSGTEPRYGAVLVFRDARERRRTEEALGRLAAILMTSSDAIISKDLNGIIQTWNQGAERMFGYRADEAIGRSIAMIMPASRLAEEQEVLKRLREGRNYEELDSVRVTKDGRTIHVSLAIWPVRDREGTVVGAAATMRDISARKRTEDAILREKESLSERVDERTEELRRTVDDLERFAYTVAHDLRAPLRSIYRYSELLLGAEREVAPETARGHLQSVMAGAKKMDLLIQDLLAYARVGRTELKRERLSLAEVLQGVVQAHRLQIDESAGQVDVSCAGSVSVTGDRFLLEQALGNLVGNALKFVAPGDVPRVEIEAEPVGAVVRIRVKDHGIGIDPRYRHRLFKVFERLQGTGYPGTGVGLAIVGKAVERMGGTVGFDSFPGRGSVFWIELPSD